MRLASHHSIRRRAAVLLTDGPSSTVDLAAALADDGLDLGDDPDDLLFEALDTSEFDLTGHGLWVHRPSVLERQRWWCPVVDGVLVLASAADLIGAVDIDRHSWHGPSGIVDGSLQVDVVDDMPVLRGPDGWLDHVGDAAELCMRDGALAVAAGASMPTATPEMVSAVRAVFEGFTAGRDLGYTHGATVVLDAMLLAPDAFRTGVIPPVAELLDGAGLEAHDGLVAEPGVDWAAVVADQTRRLLEDVYGLSGPAVDAANELLDALPALIDGSIDGSLDGSLDGGRLASLLADPDVCEAFLREGDRRGVDAPDWLAAAERLHASAPGGGVAYVYAVALEANDRVDDAIAVLEAAIETAIDGAAGREADGEPHPLALFELALYRADQGDAAGAARLLHRAGVTPDDDSAEGDLYREIEPFVARPKATAGRNDPCPCGSGRKYKACHAGSEQHPLAHRAEWLHHKAMRWAVTHEPELQQSIAFVVNERAGGDDELLEQLWHSTLVSDVVLHEAGAFDDFVTQRGHLLPADEALLAAQWQLVDRSVFEVIEVGRTQVRLRDLRTGDTIQLDDLESTDLLRSGQRVVGRPLPVGDGWRSFCGLVPLADGIVAEALLVFDDPTAASVAELIGRAFAPPTLTNSDGESLRFHELQWKVDHPHAVGAALERAGMRASGPRWMLTDDDDTIMATVSLVDDLLVGEANSDHRAEVLSALVAAALPEATMLDDDARELWELEADDDEPPTGEIDFDGPDMRAALEQFTIGYEQRWLDDEVPALGGLTPRQAAADPIGRRDLERLLSQMPDDAQPGEMSAARLRAALGI